MEFGMSRYSWFNRAAVVLCLTVVAAQGNAQDHNKAVQRPPTGKAAISAVDRSYMDPGVSPCKDFYAYANGAFEKVPIPGEYAAYGVNQEIDERNFAILKQILEDSARAGGPKGCGRSGRGWAEFRRLPAPRNWFRSLPSYRRRA